MMFQQEKQYIFQKKYVQQEETLPYLITDNVTDKILLKQLTTMWAVFVASENTNRDLQKLEIAIKVLLWRLGKILP